MFKAVLPAAFAILFASAPAFAMTDKAFLDSAIKGDNSEIMLGHLAGDKGATAEARHVGDTIEGDHSKARDQAVKLGDWRDIAAPTAATPDALAEAARLKSLSGAAFDKSFADFLVKDHEKAIAEFKAEAASGKGPVAKYAEMTVPTLEKHLHMAQALAASGK